MNIIYRHAIFHNSPDLGRVTERFTDTARGTHWPLPASLEEFARLAEEPEAEIDQFPPKIAASKGRRPKHSVLLLGDFRFGYDF